MSNMFEAKTTGDYGQRLVSLTRSIKAKISSSLTILRLPKVLVNILTWIILLSLGVILFGIVAFGVIIMAAHNEGSKKIIDSSEAEDLQRDSSLGLDMKDPSLGPVFWDEEEELAAR